MTEAGGVISDSRGLPLDFGLGATLGENFDVLVHPRLKKALDLRMLYDRSLMLVSLF